LTAEAFLLPATPLQLPSTPSLEKLLRIGVFRAIRNDLQAHLGENLDDLFNPSQSLPEKVKAVADVITFNSNLSGLFKSPPGGHAYESRVLQGVWATAPLSPQWLGAEPLGIAETRQRTHYVLQGRQSGCTIP
jgi:hypothetical protein